MRLASRIAAAAALLAALPTPASAGGAGGVSFGMSLDQQSQSGTTNRTFGVWGRLALSQRISGQVELQKIESAYDGSFIRSGTALILLDLRARGPLMPVLLAGAGVDRVAPFGGDPRMNGRHYEGGLGLEYREENGLFFGIDVRLGGRSIDNGDVILAGGDPPPVGPAVLVPSVAEGFYRSLRLSGGFRF
jgi:hypothetical protein